MKQENESLREEDGAVGGNSNDREKTVAAQRDPLQNMQLARELNLAADTAEANLRYGNCGYIRTPCWIAKLAGFLFSDNFSSE